MKDTFTIIRPGKAWKLIDVAELWQYRELLFVFAWRDIKVRYKQTALGVVWVLFQPLVSMLIFTQLFGKISNIPSYSFPYSLFVLSGLVFWIFFSNSVTMASMSMRANQDIIKKIYFPKLILPLAAIITCLVDFSITLLLLFLYSLYIGVRPQWYAIVIIPLATLLATVSATGLGLLMAALNVRYRDVGYVLPFFIQLLFFATPVIFPISIVSETNKLLLAVNPLTTVVESVRFVFSSEVIIAPMLIGISVVSTIILFFTGLWYFKRTQEFFADIV